MSSTGLRELLQISLFLLTSPLYKNWLEKIDSLYKGKCLATNIFFQGLHQTMNKIEPVLQITYIFQKHFTNFLTKECFQKLLG